MGFHPGDTFGDYKVVRLLGKGGMGEVWLLEGRSGRQVAAKILEATADHEARKRFLREAQLALGVKHPNLVETYDVGEDPDSGLCYILMEYVPGGTLADYIKANGALAIEDAVAVVEAIAGVLELGRQKGIVHRDIKPANIMFDAEGTPKLADLGIARAGNAGTETTTVTQTGVMIGTPAYMSPEQMLDAHNVDTRADIYSLGVVFFEMLTGQRPNKDDTIVQLMAKAMKGESLPDVRTLRPEVSASLAQLLNMMVAPDKDGRISTPGQITNALAIIERGGKFEADTEAIRRQREAKREALRQRRKREREIVGMTIAGIGLFAVISIGAAVWYLFGRHEPEPPAREQPEGESMRPVDVVQHVVRTNVVEKSVVRTNLVEKIAERRSAVAKTEREAAPPEKISRRPKIDNRVRIATVGSRDWCYTLEDDKAVIWCGSSGYNNDTRPAVRPNPTGRLEIPPSLDGHPVIAIGALAFFRCRELTAIVIPEGVATVRGWAFHDCDALRDVEVPDSLRVIFPGAFYACPSLERIDLNRADDFSGLAFRACKKLDRVMVRGDRSDYLMSDGALYADEGRRLVFWPRTREDVRLRDGVTTIGAGAFLGCAIRNVILPDSVRRIDSSAFSSCGQLTEVVVPDGVTDVERNAFSFCSSLRRIAFPPSLERLGYAQFDNDRRLERVGFMGNAPALIDGNLHSVLGKTAEALEIVVLNGTTGWRREGSAELPSRWPDEKMADSRPILAVSKAEMEAMFANGGPTEESSVKTAKANGYEWKYRTVSGGVEITACADGKARPRCAVEPKPTGELKIPQTLGGKRVVAIGGWTFVACKELRQVEIPDGVSALRGWGTFFGCESLERVSFPASLEEMSTKEVFVNCRSLKELKFFGEPPRLVGYGRVNGDDLIFRNAHDRFVVRVPTSAKGWQDKWPADFRSGRKVVRGDAEEPGKRTPAPTMAVETDVKVEWGRLPPVKNRDELDARLTQTKIRAVSFNPAQNVSDAMEFLRKELGLNVAFRRDGTEDSDAGLPQMQALSANDILAFEALDLICESMGCAHELRHNIVVIFPKPKEATRVARLTWSSVPSDDAAQFLRAKRLPELIVKPPMTLTDLVGMLVPLTRSDANRAQTVNWALRTKPGSPPPVLPPMIFREASVWDILDIACQNSAMEIKVDGRTVIVQPIAVKAGYEKARDGTIRMKSRFTPNQIRQMHSSDGWSAMRKSVDVMFPDWRMCDRLKKRLPPQVRKSRSAMAFGLGYRGVMDGIGDVVTTCGEGDILETGERRTIGESSVLHFQACAPNGTKIGLRGVGSQRSFDRVLLHCRGLEMEEVSFDLSEYAGSQMRLMLTVEAPAFGRNSDTPATVTWANLELR